MYFWKWIELEILETEWQQMIIIIGNHLIVSELLLSNTNTRNYVTVCKLFILNKQF